MTELTSYLEAILFASGEPVPIGRISLILNISEESVRDCAEELSAVYENGGHGLKVLYLGDKLQICTRTECASVVTKILEQRRPPVLSPSAMETLAIVAYFQPATMAYISKVRGVDSSYSVSSLVDKGLIEVQGKLEAPGRPSLYGTTDVFLRTMNISSIDQLPKLPDISNSEGVEAIKAQIEALKTAEEGQSNISEESEV